MPDQPPPLSAADAQDLAERVAKQMYARDRASQMMGMKISKVGPGHAELVMMVRADMLNGHATCHGGFIFTLADSAFAFACNSNNLTTVASDQAAIQKDLSQSGGPPFDGGGGFVGGVGFGFRGSLASALSSVGVVTNAAVRDMAQIREMKFPVYAPGVNVRGTVKSHAGWTNIPIAIADVSVPAESMK